MAPQGDVELEPPDFSFLTNVDPDVHPPPHRPIGVFVVVFSEYKLVKLNGRGGGQER